MEDIVSTPRKHPLSPSGSSSMSGLVWHNGQPVLQMQDAVVETVVTHTTRTTTSFAPITLPRLPEPEYIPIPSYLSNELYPLANEPIPEDMKFFAMHLGGQRVVVQEDGTPGGGLTSPLPTETGGPGWKRSMKSQGFKNEMKRVGLVGALQDGKKVGKDVRKRSLSFSRASGGAKTSAPTPPVTGEGKGKARARSPPRKRTRGLDEINTLGQAQGLEGALLSPLSSPDQDGLASSSSSSSKSVPNIGSGVEMAALFSLPNLITHFESLPDKLQQHVMMQLLRRSRMPTIQRVTSFASIALKRDFVSALPHELAVQILRCVDTKTLLRAARVSKKWKRMIDTERGVWKQRLVDDNLWQGLGTEEEEEKVMKQRLWTLRWLGLPVSKGATPSEEEIMDLPSAGTAPLHSTNFDNDQSDNYIPLKHVYRRRFTSEQNWLNKTPSHRSFPGQGMNVVTCTQFDRDKIITASDDHSINIYDINQGTLKRRLDGHEGGVWALEYRGDTLVTGSTDRTVRVWDLKTYEEVHTFHGHSSTVRCLQIVEPVLDEQTGEYMPPYPMFVTGSRDSSLRVWKLPKKGEARCNTYTDEGVEEILKPENNPFHLHQLSGHSQAVRAIATYGRLCMSGSYDCTVRVWDIIKGTCLHVLTGHEARVYSLVYDRYRNRCASGSMDNTVKVWDVATGECLHTLSGHTALVGLLETSPNYLVSAAADASLRIWDANTNELKQILGAHGGAITCFAHDETKVVSGSEGSIKLWDIRTGRFIRELVVGIQSVWQVVFKDNILVAATSRGGATVFEIFDFGALDDPSGVDDEALDEFRRPAWERIDPREPQAYQFDDEDGEVLPIAPGAYQYLGAGTSGSGMRYHKSRSRNPTFDSSSVPARASGSGGSGSRSRRSARIAGPDTGSGSRAGTPSVSGSGTKAIRDRLRGPPTASTPRQHQASRLQALLQSSAHSNHPQSHAGPSNYRSTQPSSSRRSHGMTRRSDSPTPVGDSHAPVSMMAATTSRNIEMYGPDTPEHHQDGDLHLGVGEPHEDDSMDIVGGDEEVWAEEEEELEEPEDEEEEEEEEEEAEEEEDEFSGVRTEKNKRDLRRLDEQIRSRRRRGNAEEDMGGYYGWDVDVD